MIWSWNATHESNFNFHLISWSFNLNLEPYHTSAASINRESSQHNLKKIKGMKLLLQLADVIGSYQVKGLGKKDTTPMC